jgi:hypothetical protein
VILQWPHTQMWRFAFVSILEGAVSSFLRGTFRGTKGSVDSFAVIDESEAIVRPQVESSTCERKNKADPAKTGGASEMETEARATQDRGMQFDGASPHCVILFLRGGAVW